MLNILDLHEEDAFDLGDESRAIRGTIQKQSMIALAKLKELFWRVTVLDAKGGILHQRKDGHDVCLQNRQMVFEDGRVKPGQLSTE